ncbi:MAG: hypothetical protein KW793_03470 [Candidatus Doudnabacteria bacterium]|nr:hypothetical protein [Candidatus Doudnabacteria bacterium]
MNTIVENKPVPQNFILAPITDDQFILGDGNLSAEVLMPNGHGWDEYLPLAEVQSRGSLETSCCSAYGTLNCIEAIGKKKYGASFQNNLSERYLSIMAGMDGNGGFPHLIAETLRKESGAIPEVFLPFTDKITTLNQYFSPKPMSYSLFKVGRHWLTKYTVGHEWVFMGGTITEKQTKMKEALKYSPLGVAGYAWSLHTDGKYYHDGPDIHWFQIYDFKEGEYWLANDTYFPFVKKLDWNYDFGYCKRYSLTRKLGGEHLTDEPGNAILPYSLYLLKYFISKFTNR